MAVRTLGFRQGSLASRYSQIYLAFALSGFTHALGDLKVAPHIVSSAGFRSLVVHGALPFFMMQAVAITVEDATITLFKRVLLRLHLLPAKAVPLRLVGYVWTLGWFLVSWGWYCEFSFRAGMLRSERLPFSPIRTLLLPTLSTLKLDMKELFPPILACISTLILWWVSERLRKRRMASSLIRFVDEAYAKFHPSSIVMSQLLVRVLDF
jgi:hypothetical protein